MKRKIIGIIVIVVAVVAGYNVYTLKTNEKLSALALANVEALAYDEEGGGGITCNQSKHTTPGTCWIMMDECYIAGLVRFDDCKFSGYMAHHCNTPCD